MRIIKLDAIDSTNTFLKGLSSGKPIEDYTVVVANKQTGGRGQMGTVWRSEAYKNLTFSVFKELGFLRTNQQFYISIVTALALVKTLAFFSINKLSVKWPNDILSANYKICGVLIETVIKHNALSSCIVGVGLNVNQSNFDGLPKASSMVLLSGNAFNLDEILQRYLVDLESYFKRLEAGECKVLKADYEALLFRKNKPSTFKNSEGLLFSGFIKGISESGNLIIQLEDEILQEFSLKQVTLLY